MRVSAQGLSARAAYDQEDIFMATRLFSRRPVWIAVLSAALVAGGLSIPAVRNLGQKSLASLRIEKGQAVNLDLSPFVDANANPSLHQMVAQMISEKVEVMVNENDQPVADRQAAGQLAGFHVQLPSARSDSPTLVVG